MVGKERLRILRIEEGCRCSSVVEFSVTDHIAFLSPLVNTEEIFDMPPLFGLVFPCFFKKRPVSNPAFGPNQLSFVWRQILLIDTAFQKTKTSTEHIRKNKNSKKDEKKTRCKTSESFEANLS